MQQATLPAPLQQAIGTESYDFVVKSTRRYQPKEAVKLIIFGMFWLGMIGIIAFSTVVPFLSGQDVHVTVNDVPRTFNISDGIGVYQLLAKGRWYVGTEKALIEYSPKQTRYIDWDNCTGDVITRSHAVIITLKTGKWQRNNSSRHSNVSVHSSRFVPDQVYISGLDNAQTISQYIRNRIDIAQSEEK